MKIRTVVTVIGLLMFNVAFGQSQEKYREFVKEALKLYESKEYQKSADKYKEAFDQVNGTAHPKERYKAACSYALSGDIENSFYHLFRLAENPKIKYKNYGYITKDTDLRFLHKDTRWNKLIAIVKSNKEEA